MRRIKRRLRRLMQAAVFGTAMFVGPAAWAMPRQPDGGGPVSTATRSAGSGWSDWLTVTIVLAAIVVAGLLLRSVQATRHPTVPSH